MHSGRGLCEPPPASDPPSRHRSTNAVSLTSTWPMYGAHFSDCLESLRLTQAKYFPPRERKYGASSYHTGETARSRHFG